jgi:hypothetical protein
MFNKQQDVLPPDREPIATFDKVKIPLEAVNAGEKKPLKSLLPLKKEA